MLAPEPVRRSYPADATISQWRTPDGWGLRVFHRPAPEIARPRGSILFQGGRGDVFEKYLETFDHWHAQGWAVTSLDWRGQGGSGRLSRDERVGHVEDFAVWIEDIGAFWRDVIAKQPGPHVAIGHSMGGHLVLRALAERVIDAAAAVLVAPMLGLHAPISPRFGERLATMLGSVGNPARRAWRANEKPGATETREALLTHDADRYADEIYWQQAKPELRLGPPSWRWVMQAFTSTRLLRDGVALRAVRTPVLMLVAEADKLVSPRAALQVAERLPDARVVRFGSESAHEILREADPVRDRALGEIDIFLASRAQAQ